jgi:hypothetical protein
LGVPRGDSRALEFRYQNGKAAAFLLIFSEPVSRAFDGGITRDDEPLYGVDVISIAIS